MNILDYYMYVILIYIFKLIRYRSNNDKMPVKCSVVKHGGGVAGVSSCFPCQKFPVFGLQIFSMNYVNTEVGERY